MARTRWKDERYSLEKIYTYTFSFLFEGEIIFAYASYTQIIYAYAHKIQLTAERIDTRAAANERMPFAIILVGILFILHSPLGDALLLTRTSDKKFHLLKQLDDLLSSIFGIFCIVPLNISKFMDYAAKCRSVLIFFMACMSVLQAAAAAACHCTWVLI